MGGCNDSVGIKDEVPMVREVIKKNEKMINSFMTSDLQFKENVEANDLTSSRRYLVELISSTSPDIYECIKSKSNSNTLISLFNFEVKRKAEIAQSENYISHSILNRSNTLDTILKDFKTFPCISKAQDDKCDSTRSALMNAPVYIKQDQDTLLSKEISENTVGDKCSEKTVLSERLCILGKENAVKMTN